MFWMVVVGLRFIVGTVIDDPKLTTENNVIRSIQRAIVQVLPLREVFAARVASILFSKSFLPET